MPLLYWGKGFGLKNKTERFFRSADLVTEQVRPNFHFICFVCFALFCFVLLCFVLKKLSGVKMINNLPTQFIFVGFVHFYNFKIRFFSSGDDFVRMIEWGFVVFDHDPNGLYTLSLQLCYTQLLQKHRNKN